MAMKHDADSGDVNMMILDNGQLVYVCSRCSRTWLGRVDPSDVADDDSKRAIAAAIRGASPELADWGVDVDTVVRSLEP